MSGDTAVSCAKLAEPIDIPFGLWTRLGPRKHMLYGVHIDAIWRIREPSICGGDAAFLSNYVDHLFSVLQSYCTKKAYSHRTSGYHMMATYFYTRVTLSR